MLVDTTFRSDEEELMDDMDCQGEVLHDTLDKLAKINKWLGGNAVTISGIEKALKNCSKEGVITIIDLGCGGGDMLRVISEFGKRKGYNFRLIGIDANSHIIQYASQNSESYPNIEYSTIDIFSEAFHNFKYDLVLATLFFHHFKSEDLVGFLEPVIKKAKFGIVVNDLHRHKLAYYLFKLLSITIKNEMVKQDGLTSILRGFKKQELIAISEQIKANHEIQWKWAFRFQWLLKRK